MIDPPHPSLRKLWTEASTPGRTVRELCVLQRACLLLLNSTLDLPILDSEEVVEPLIQFGPFDLSINEALARYDVEHDSSQGVPVTASSRLGPPVSEVRSGPGKLSLPREVEASPARLAEPGSSDQANAGKLRENTPATIFAPEFPSLKTADRQNRPKPVSRAETVSLVDDKVRGDIREVERAVRDPVLGETSRPIPNTPALRGGNEAAAFDSQPVIPVPLTDSERSVPQVSFASTSPKAKPHRASLYQKPDLEGGAVRPANEIKIGGKNKATGAASRRGDLFEQVLGGAMERLARQPRRPQLTTEHPPGRAHFGEDALIDQKVYPEGRHDFPRSALARLAAGATRNGGRQVREIRAAQEREFASFAAATCFADRDGAQFASHLNTLLRQELLRHGISLEDSE